MPTPMHISSPDSPRLKGIALPPSGLALAVLLLLYIFVGLIGHDPWKHDDAITAFVNLGVSVDAIISKHIIWPADT